jgi:ketosteroid isomerase-like protein
MSEENVEIVRRVYEALARDDTASVLAAYDEDIVFDLSRSPFREFLPKHIVRGHDGLRAFFGERHEAWESLVDECVDLIDAGDRVISNVITHGRGRASGIETGRSHYGVWTIRGGKVIRTQWFGTRDEALEAAGLSE